MLLGVVACFSVGVVEVLLELVLDNLLGDGDLDELNELCEDLVACLGALLGNLSFCNLLLDVFLQLVDGVELGSQLCELVVSCGQLALLDCGELDLDGCLLACVLAAGELGLEGCVLASGQAGQSLVDAVEHGAGTDLVGQVVCCVYLLAVDFCGDVDGHEVLVSCGALNGLQGAEALTQSVQCLNLVLSGDLYLVNLNLEALVVGQLDFGADGDGDGQLDVCLTVLGGGLGLNVQLGLCQGGEFVLAQCLCVVVVQSVVQGCLDDVVEARTLLDELLGQLTLAEAGNADLTREVLVGAVQVGLEFCEGNLDLNLCEGRVELLDGGLHVRDLLI